MNTATCLTTDKEKFKQKLLDLMHKDGFGFDEAIAHQREYAQEIFGNLTNTGVSRVSMVLRQMETEALKY